MTTVYDSKEAIAYQEAVDRGDWPGNPRVPLEPRFENSAGWIQNLLLRGCRSVAAILSLRGSRRANHFHKTDWHYTYVASGTVFYFERAVGFDEMPEPLVFRTGEVFFTPPMREHCMLFAEDTLIVTMARNERSHDKHEDDVERVEFVTQKIARQYVPEA